MEVGNSIRKETTQEIGASGAAGDSVTAANSKYSSASFFADNWRVYLLFFLIAVTNHLTKSFKKGLILAHSSRVHSLVVQKACVGNTRQSVTLYLLVAIRREMSTLLKLLFLFM